MSTTPRPKQPYEQDNEAATKHGAGSERRWRPIAERLATELLVERPWLAQHRRTVDAWARTTAQLELIGTWLDDNGLLDDDGVPRKASDRLDRLESRAQSLRADLAETPMAMARLLGTLTATAVTAGHVDAVAALAAEGRQLVDAWKASEVSAPTGSPTAALAGAQAGLEDGEL
jgi:hypothetical protein